ncbi:NACHT C-terminal helical domain 2-containing protein [Microcoleus anatoxicus]|uniref:NACHT C-terminal helical domain 2-containing protein n=2 Tax=Microcoleus anatoxicus TaxID=2705319 RepID=UPI0030C987B5
MMVRTPDSSEDLFAEAGTNWDLQKLYKDLAVAKRKFASTKRLGLTETEKKHLRGLLCGYSPTQMAEKLYKSSRGKELLVQYYQANKFLMECLNSGSNVSPEVRSHIEYNLFLPVDSSLSSKKQGKRCSS